MPGQACGRGCGARTTCQSAQDADGDRSVTSQELLAERNSDLDCDKNNPNCAMFLIRTGEPIGADCT